MSSDFRKIMSLPWKIGAHTEFDGMIKNTLMRSISKGMYATQFFMGSSLSPKRSVILDDDVKASISILDRYPMYVFTHFPYVVNLAGSKDILAWNGDSKQDSKTNMNIKQLEYELNILGNFENNGVVIHPGNHKNRENGLSAIAESINKINFKKNAKLILENSAGQGTSLATTFEEISFIIENIDQKKHIGVCIDTCHLFAYGDYDLSKVDEMERMFTDFDEKIGLKYLSLFHLNDSETKLKSKTDRHAHLKTGHIWKESDESLLFLLEKCNKLSVPLILETSDIDIITLCTL